MEWIEGKKVEFRSDMLGYEGAWIEGTVKARSGGCGFCNIQCDKFVMNNGEPLVEKVDVDNLRPIPPQTQLPVPLPERLVIEAYDRNCWRRGFIVRRVYCGEELWLVSFPDTQSLKAYPLSALRPAHDWNEGIWTLVGKV